MAINVVGVVGIVLFYIVILVIGLWAARRRGQPTQQDSASEDVMLAGRSIGLFVGTFTMTATWVGGGYINGTAEVVNRRGLIWAQSGWGYALSLLLGGVLFAKIMRRQGYVTMLDPFQERYGIRVGGIMYIPAFLGELLWSAATLNSLGATISVVFDLDMNVSVITSACIAILYTILGGLWSVAFTDVAQLICMFIGMWLTIPFAMTHEAVAKISTTVDEWNGEAGWVWSDFGTWIDYAFLLIFGGIPWQVYFQRVLSSKTYSRAQFLSYAAALGCIFMVIPPTLIGAIGKSTTSTFNASEGVVCECSFLGRKVGVWNSGVNMCKLVNGYDPLGHLKGWEYTDYNATGKLGNNSQINYQQTMPLVLQYLTPPGVSFIGLGAVSAAVMSSVDSSVLSASSMFANNIYKAILRQNASEKELLWVIRVSILVVGFLATCIGLTVESIYGLSILCSDLIYVILFPQLLCVIYFRYSNSYGAVFSFTCGFIIRILSGESMIGLPALIEFPGFKDGEQRFPFRTFAMIITLFTLWLSSTVVHILFERGTIPKQYDFAGVFKEEPEPFSFGQMFVAKGVTTKRDRDKALAKANDEKMMNSEEVELMSTA